MTIKEELNQIFPQQDEIRQHDFPLLDKLNRIYLDNTATSQEPFSVINQMHEFRLHTIRGSNHSENSFEAKHYDTLLKEVRQKVSDFFHASNYCIVFTKNTTESSNLIGCRFPFDQDSTLIVTEMEHNSEIVTSANMCQKTGGKVQYAPIDVNGRLDLEKLDDLIQQAKGKVLLNIVHIANFTGLINPLKEIKKRYGDKIFVYADLAQSGGHLPINLNEMNVDFAGTSSHKMNGPMGMGVLFIRLDRVDMLSREIAGGGAVKRVTKGQFIYMDSPACFEPGTQDLEGIIEFGFTLDYLSAIGMERIHQYDFAITRHFYHELKKIKEIRCFGPCEFQDDRTAIVPFNIWDIYSHNQAARELDKRGISVRNGCFCAHIYVARMIGLSDEEYNRIVKQDLSHEDLPGAVRASLSFYNNLRDVDRTLEAISILAKQKKPL